MDQLFNAAILSLWVPDTSLQYPPTGSADEWLDRLRSESVERKQAFYDEQLQSYLTIDIHISAESPEPPKDLLAFLAHLQVTLEATYISAVPAPRPETPQSTLLLSAPPRLTHGKQSTPKLGGTHHPSIFPPSTPNPTPFSADIDRRYLQSEGTLLQALIWGQDASESSREAFTLLRSTRNNNWVAVYRLSVTIAFLRLTFYEPLLCLTVSTTLRNKPLNLNTKNALTAFLTSSGVTRDVTEPPSPTSEGLNAEGLVAEPSHLEGFEEVNLLDGLLGGPTFASDLSAQTSAIRLPSSRLGAVSRHKLFSLPAIIPPTPVLPTPSPMTAVRATAASTLRKSYRKTLSTVSGFRIRMRTVFVPAVLIAESLDEEPCDEAEERDRREAGNEERTVVLCVEVENSGDSGPGVAFVIERVEISVSGEGAKTTMIGWDDAQSKSQKGDRFPVIVGAREQVNLLYAVSFLRSPEEVETLMGFSTSSRPNLDKTLSVPNVELSLQRAVTISISGKPCHPGTSSSGDLLFPTDSFSSKWNCVLDLSTPTQTKQQNTLLDTSVVIDSLDIRPPPKDVQPEPASPFPVTITSPKNAIDTIPQRRSSLTIMSPPSTAGSAAFPSAGSKRHTLPSGGLNGPAGFRSATKSIPPTPSYRASTSMINSRVDSSRLPPIPPLQIHSPLKSPTTYDAPYGSENTADVIPPMTPAYHSFGPTSSPIPPTPQFQPPVSHAMENLISSSVEIRRERAQVAFDGLSSRPFSAAISANGQTPAPVIGFGPVADQSDGSIFEQFQNQPLHGMGLGTEGGIIATADHEQSVVVSVGLLPGDGNGKVFPLSNFTLNIFVFNRSDRTRRFEVTCPDMRRKFRRQTSDPTSLRLGVGVLPLDNRVRVGPLLPSACQSVRMQFLAIAPGVHAIDALTITDVENGVAKTLRSVLDVVVHDCG